MCECNLSGNMIDCSKTKVPIQYCPVCGRKLGTSAIYEEPMDMEKMFESVNDQWYLEGQIKVDLGEICSSEEHDYDAFLDLLSSRLTGSPLMEDISYEATGVTEDGEIILKVRGYVLDIIDEKYEDAFDEHWRELESVLFLRGYDAIADFLDDEEYEKFARDDDAVSSMLREVRDQMPNEELMKFYKKYVVD